MTAKDYASGQRVRWCPGCGDYAVLAAMQKMLAVLGVPKERIAFVSGIGCSSRFPYYMGTYGFHTAHGRAPAIATGLKGCRPDLSVWVMTGDGDGLSIGGNHLIHALRRNVDIKVVLFNNRIYGLTKGQASPTSELGKKTKSTPMGSVDHPVLPASLALAAGATFVARAVDNDLAALGECLRRAALHRGAAFVEVLQTCVVFNPGAWTGIADKGGREERALRLEHGRPLVFGKDRGRGLRLNGCAAEAVSFDPASPPADLLVHDEKSPSTALSHLLAELEGPALPTPLGVFRAVERPTLHELMDRQIAQAAAQRPPDAGRLLAGSMTWTVEKAGA
ncbi:MAG: 2-oxoacid:ferredoxin oxidoreductase subunit beta [Elusimicrobia bacterium]|nr:2-oxoacid:ferredoxin oxidoreductase subunit beta [Elusimicrobiota bacterium]